MRHQPCDHEGAQEVPARGQEPDDDLGLCRRCGGVATVVLAEPDVVLCRSCADTLGREALTPEL